MLLSHYSYLKFNSWHACIIWRFLTGCSVSDAYPRWSCMKQLKRVQPWMPPPPIYNLPLGEMPTYFQSLLLVLLKTCNDCTQLKAPVMTNSLQRNFIYINTRTKIGTIQRRLTWSLHKERNDDLWIWALEMNKTQTSKYPRLDGLSPSSF